MNKKVIVLNGSSKLKLSIHFKKINHLKKLPHNLEIVSMSIIREEGKKYQGFIMEIKLNNAAEGLDHVSFFKAHNYIDQEQENELILELENFLLKKVI